MGGVLGLRHRPQRKEEPIVLNRLGQDDHSPVYAIFIFAPLCAGPVTFTIFFSPASWAVLSTVYRRGH